MAAPKRELLKAAEVCDVVQVQPYVLRSWEAEFPQIGLVPSGGGARVYRRSDVELVLRIKQLILDEGLTLSGARRRLDEESGASEEPSVSVEEIIDEHVRQRLKHVKTGLQSILELLSSNGDHQAELRLVSPQASAEPRKKTVAKSKPKK
jgi:DNA-binding transcriptional MerR regulator